MSNKLEELVKSHFKDLYENDFYINDWEEDERTITIEVKENNHAAKCPCCGQETKRIHARNIRRVQDIPYSQKTTYLKLYVNKYVCLNPDCPRKTFVEELDFVGRNRTRTFRLEVYILSVSRMLSNEAASQILKENHIIVSNDTINRLYQRLEFKEIKDPVEVGIDDVAILKGHNYATVVYDSKTHEMIALFAGRGTEETKEWLKGHPKIKRIARDRNSSYAKAINEILPECEQIADRFHLLQNMSEKLEKVFKEELPAAFYFKDGQILEGEPKKIKQIAPPNPKHQQKLDKLDYDNSVPVDENGEEIRFEDKLIDRNGIQAQKNTENRKKKQKLIREVQAFWESLEHKTYTTVSREFGVCISTVKKYISMTKEEICALDQPKFYKRRTKRPIYNWINMIYKMARDGYSAYDIFCTVRSRADSSLTDKSLSNAVRSIIRNNFPGRPSNVDHEVHSYPPDVLVVQRRDLLKYIISGKSSIPDFEIYFESIMEKYPIVRLYEEIYKLFYETIMGDEVEKLQVFLEAVDFIKELKGFCSSIKQDIDAVKRSISSELSSGFVEGLNCKFKLIKRILYGRSNIVNLEKKCILYFMKDKTNKTLTEIVKNTFRSKQF